MDKFGKAICGATSYIFTYLTKTINEIFVILALLMIFDYITGIIIAIKEGKFSYKQGILGVVKKLSYIMILATGYLVDYLVNYLSKRVGLDFQTYGSLGFVVTFYLLGNEGISLCYNWSSLGLPVPKTLMIIFEKFKSISNDGNLVNKRRNKNGKS